MSALTTRQDARERLRKMFEGALDQLIPPDESVRLKGSRFADFEGQVEALPRDVAGGVGGAGGPGSSQCC